MKRLYAILWTTAESALLVPIIWTLNNVDFKYNYWTIAIYFTATLARHIYGFILLDERKKECDKR